MQLGFNLSNGVTVTLESSPILIYFVQVESSYTQKVWQEGALIKTIHKEGIKKGTLLQIKLKGFNIM